MVTTWDLENGYIDYLVIGKDGTVFAKHFCDLDSQPVRIPGGGALKIGRNTTIWDLRDKLRDKPCALRKYRIKHK